MFKNSDREVSLRDFEKAARKSQVAVRTFPQPDPAENSEANSLPPTKKVKYADKLLRENIASGLVSDNVDESYTDTDGHRKSTRVSSTGLNDTPDVFKFDPKRIKNGKPMSLYLQQKEFSQRLEANTPVAPPAVSSTIVPRHKLPFQATDQARKRLHESFAAAATTSTNRNDVSNSRATYVIVDNVRKKKNVVDTSVENASTVITQSAHKIYRFNPNKMFNKKPMSDYMQRKAHNAKYPESPVFVFNPKLKAGGKTMALFYQKQLFDSEQESRAKRDTKRKFSSVIEEYPSHVLLQGGSSNNSGAGDSDGSDSDDLQSVDIDVISDHDVSETFKPPADNNIKYVLLPFVSKWLICSFFAGPLMLQPNRGLA